MVSRRRLLLGLGSLCLGSAVVASAAFDTVGADRSVTVETAGDADAVLALEPADGADRYVEQVGGKIVLTLDGINRNANTRFSHLVDLTNRGTQTIEELTLAFVEGDEELLEVIGFSLSYPGGGFGTVSGGSVNTDAPSLEPGETLTFGLAFDLTREDAPNGIDEFELVLQITARTDGG